MAEGRSDGEEDDPNDVVLTSMSLTAETTIGTLTGPPPNLPTLPFDVLPEILCRLPVKLLVQLRCLCKFFNSLISDPKFAKKHLQSSTKPHHLMLTTIDDQQFVMYDSPIPSVFSTSTIVAQSQLYPPGGDTYASLRSSCNGIFLGLFTHFSYFLWNLSIRKFKLLPPLENPDKSAPFTIIVPFTISFGYDCFIDKYKIIAVTSKNEVFVHTLGTDYWTRIDDIPYYCSIGRSGLYVSGAVNWYVHDESDSSLYFILSLDLKSESYQQLYLPDFGDGSYSWTLGVLSDYLCVFATSDMFLNVWIMKEYGNQESWTKLCSVPKDDHGFEASAAIYISEDDQLLLQCYEFESGEEKLVVYDTKTGTFNILEFQNNYEHISQNVYIESLISP